MILPFKGFFKNCLKNFDSSHIIFFKFSKFLFSLYFSIPNVFVFVVIYFFDISLINFIVSPRKSFSKNKRKDLINKSISLFIEDSFLSFPKLLLSKSHNLN